MLIKQTWVRPRPPNVTGMVTGPGNQLRLRTTDGRDLMVPAPQ
jgi:hypothetical protein